MSQPFGFKVQQKLISVGATYNIYDMATDQQVFEAKRQILTIPPRIVIKDMSGNEVVRVEANFLLKNKWTIYHKGAAIGDVSFPIFRLFGKSFTVTIHNEQYDAFDVFGYSFSARNTKGEVGFKVDKKFFSFRDTYKVEVFPGLDPIFALVAAITIDYKYYQGN